MIKEGLSEEVVSLQRLRWERCGLQEEETDRRMACSGRGGWDCAWLARQAGTNAGPPGLGFARGVYLNFDESLWEVFFYYDKIYTS